MTSTALPAATPSIGPIRTGTSPGLATARAEQYVGTAEGLQRVVQRRDGTRVTSLVVPGALERDPIDNAEGDQLWLRAGSADTVRRHVGDDRIVDLFAGCGGLSIGVVEALHAVGRGARCIGVELDPVALSVYQRNLPGARGLCSDIASVLDRPLGTRPSSSERALRELAGDVTFLLGGPPCQGHSAFNNRTRHSDDRNALYLKMVRAAEVLEPEFVVIENVPGALKDRGGVVQRSVDALAILGYETRVEVVDASTVGVAQVRKRLLVTASRDGSRVASGLAERWRSEPRSVRWAIGDLVRRRTGLLVDEPAASAPQTRGRIDVLFEQRLYELPNEHRPPCHAKGGHSYRSIYGRLRWDRPAQTVTTGFYSMCMGRNVHPSQRRTITAREAARLQFLPDGIDWSTVPGRVDLARLIGNAVPPRLGYIAALDLIR